MRKLMCLVLLGGLVLFLSGCSKTYLAGLEPQSHFDFPNSNVTPIGKAVGESSSAAFFSMPDMTSDFHKKAIDQALQSRGGDILINYMGTYTYTDLLFIHMVKYRVEGTACKAEIGTQQLM